MPSNNLPLANIHILDLTRLMPGPFGTQILADLGADVIRVDSPQMDYTRFIPPFVAGTNSESQWGGLFLAVNRNKKSIYLDLKREDHKQIMKSLILYCDVIIEGFRPGVMEKLGFGYQQVKELNSRIIYASISGFGQNGPYASFPGHDMNYQGIAGLLGALLSSHAQNSTSPPMLPIPPISDLAAGMYAVIGILAALEMRHNTNMGTYIDISIFEAAIAWSVSFPPLLGILNGTFTQNANSFRENPLSGQMPYYSLYRTKDNQWLTLGTLEPIFWERFCNALGLIDLIEHQYPKSLDEARTIYENLQKIFLMKNLNEWIEFFQDKDTCIYPVKTFHDLKRDPHVIERHIIAEVPHPDGGIYFSPKTPILFNNLSRENFTPPPEVGQHAQTILKDLGYTESQIKEYMNNMYQ